MVAFEKNVAKYQHLTDDEILHLAEDRDQLTDNARLALDVELSRRRLAPSDIEADRIEREAVDKTEKLTNVVRFYIDRVGLGKKFLGKASRRRDPSGLFEQYDTTLWFVVLWCPVFPIATYTVRRDLERWWGGVSASDEIALERHPRNWEQVLLTWVKASAVLLAIRLTLLLLAHHPAWLRHLP
jgi:hypothetical protein